MSKVKFRLIGSAVYQTRNGLETEQIDTMSIDLIHAVSEDHFHDVCGRGEPVVQVNYQLLKRKITGSKIIIYTKPVLSWTDTKIRRVEMEDLLTT